MKTVCALVTLCVAFTQAACSTTRVIRDRDYENSVNAYRRGDTAAALERFPASENGGLITSIEKSWLSSWRRQWNPEPLQKQTATFAERKYISLTREADYFLLQEAEEGYLPSEHEVAILHLLSALHFLQTARQDDAQVELREAGYILDRYWDDAALRLWLASLWSAAGHWEEAQVDLRRANELRPSRELKKLSEGPAPRRLALQFYGAAPVTTWKEGEYVPHFSEEPSEPHDEPIHASTLPWFKRHQKRGNELRDILLKSNFMAQYLGSKALTETERGINKTAAWSVRGAAVVVGAAITAGVIYAVAQTGAGDSLQGDVIGPLLGGGLLVGTAIWKTGDKIDHSLAQSPRAEENQKNDDLKIYRMVRFLPGWISLTDKEAFTGTADTIELNSTAATKVLWVNHY